MELDIVAESIDKKYLLVRECKWPDWNIHSDTLLQKLEQKAAVLPFLNGKTIIPCLFLKHFSQEKGKRNNFVPKNTIQ